MRVYTTLSRLPLASSYTAKVLVLTFVGVHIPLITLVVGTLIATQASSADWVLSISWTLGGTLVATLATLGLLYSLLWPVRAAARALDDFVTSGRLPELPSGYTDEAGAVMAGVQRTLVELKSRMELLEHEAATDPLTGLHNRRWFDAWLHHAWNRDETPDAKGLALILLDIDQFKSINDQHGHAVGDEVLRDLSSLMQTELRSQDIKVRWGGEEFALVMPEMSAELAHAATERLLQKVRTRSLGGLAEGAVTLSGGTSTSAETANVDELIKTADDRLYAAKNAGRDQVCST